MKENKITFRRLYASYTFFVIPFSLLAAILALLDVVPVDYNNEPRHGIVGFIVPIAFTPFISFLLSGASWLAITVGGFFFDNFLKVLRLLKK